MPFVNLTKITVRGPLLNFDETAAVGTITFTPAVGLRDLRDAAGNQVIVPKAKTVVLDVNGDFSVALPATDDPDVAPTGFTYHVIENIPGRSDANPYEYDIVLPVASPGGIAYLADLIPVSPNTGFTNYALETEAVDLRARVLALETAGFAVTGERMFSKAGTAVVAAGVARWYAPVNCTITNVIASAGIAPTGTVPLLVDVKLDGTTIFTGGANRPSIAPGTNVDMSSVPAVTFVAQGHYLTADIVQVGNSFAGSDLDVQVLIA